MTISDISKLLSVNPETVRRWIRNDKLKARYESKKSGYVIFEHDLNDFLDKHPKYASAHAFIDWNTIEDNLLNDINVSEKKIKELHLLIVEEEKKLSKLRELQKKIKELG